MKSKAVVVTGISTGIGASTAEYLAGKSYHVFGSVRRAANGERLQSRLGAAFTPLIMDVMDEGAILAAAADVGRMGDPPERMARTIHHALTTPSPKTRYAPVHGKFLNWTLPGLLPKRFVDRKIGRALGLLG